jgi:SAM-dependent methyltransferase
MSLIYRAFYRFGLTPWEQDDPAEPLAELVTGRAAQAPGKALDIGCGTGSDAIFCARNGWEVTGIDDVPLALKRARAKATEAGVNVRFEQADVTRTGPEQIGTGYRLLVDMGCLHNLEPRVRPAVGRLLTSVAAPGATLLMMTFATGGPRPGPVGLDAADVKAMFPEWDVAFSRPAHDVPLTGRMATVEPHYYQLKRR